LDSTRGAGGLATLAADAFADYWDSWFATYTRMVDRLKASPQSKYWRHWFDAYSQSIRHLQTQTNS
jgi:hypothetical protein